MIFQLNLAAIAAITTQAAWKKTKPVILKDVFILPVLGFLGIIVLWWIIALVNHELMPTPPEALIANLDYISNPFYQRVPGNLGIGWLLIASLRRVCIKCPKDDYKVEPPEVFIDKKGFNPSDLVGYLNSFAIRANAPTNFFMS